MRRARGLAALLLLALVIEGCTSSPPSSAPAASASRTVSPPRPVGITLPEVLAIELPAADMTEIAPAASPLRELLDSAAASGLRVTHDQAGPLPVGATSVTWTGWRSLTGADVAETTRSAFVYVFPFGQTPAGVSQRRDATGGNNSSKVIRDAEGKVHVAWLDADRPGTVSGVFYRRGVHDVATGAFTWDGPPVRVSPERSPAEHLGLAASPGAIHFAWYAHERAWYRRLVHAGGAWRFDPIRETGATGRAGDTGPSIAVRGDDEVHVLTYTGRYAVSKDGGVRFAVEQVPWPPGGKKKNPALAIDAQGNIHVVFVLLARALDQGRGSYWQLWYIRREAGGRWVDPHEILTASPEWRDGGLSRDVLADWPDIAVDARGDIHVAWHGTANTGAYGRDEPFYIRRPAIGRGEWGAWEPPTSLRPVNRAGRQSFGFAPSLSMDPAADGVVATVFFETPDLPRGVFDSDAVLLRSGRIAAPPVALSRMAETALRQGKTADALSAWFPTAAPHLFRSPDGRVWLDVLYTAHTPEPHQSSSYVIYQRRDITELVNPAR
jgi:hypothetical protein